MKTHLIAAAAVASIVSASPAWPAHALDEHDSYRPFGAGPLTCGSFVRAVDGLDPRDKDSPQVTFTNYKRFVNGWLTAADRFIPGLNDATGGRDADWFTGVLVNHCRADPSLTIADALEQIIKIRFPRLFAEKAPPVTYRSTATNNMLDKPPADETISAATDRAEAAGHREAGLIHPKLSTLSDNSPTTPNMSGQIQENGIVKYGSQPSKLIASSSPKIRAYDPVLAAAFIRAECDFYTRTYEPNSPEIAARDWKTPFIHECQDRETAAMAWIADQWSTMPYKQYALCVAPYNRQLAEYGDTILAQQNMEYHQTYFMYEIIQSCIATGWPMPEGYWTKEEREMYLD